MRRTLTTALLIALAAVPGHAEDALPAAPDRPPDAEHAEPVTVDRGKAVNAALAWLDTHQGENGSWGGHHTIAVTSLACLAHLAASDEPFEGERGRPLVAALTHLLSRQDQGVFAKEGHTWIHGQGFATLALSEAYGRALRARTQPDLDLDRLRAVVQKAVAAIQEHQSTSGGWWYTQGEKHQHEGSTTVCAVQALVSAQSFRLEVDQAVLDRGFEYLKQCQNEDGGFDYRLGDAHSMKEGTAAGVATLALMKRMDYGVMIDGVGYLTTLTTDRLAHERFPYYGWFYGTMGMRLYGEEMGAEKTTAPWIARSHELLAAWQAEDGSFPLKGWMASSSSADGPYATAFAALVLSVPDGRLSIFNRTPPELPERAPSSAVGDDVPEHAADPDEDGE